MLQKRAVEKSCRLWYNNVMNFFHTSLTQKRFIFGIPPKQEGLKFHDREVPAKSEIQAAAPAKSSKPLLEDLRTEVERKLEVQELSREVAMRSPEIRKIVRESGGPKNFNRALNILGKLMENPQWKEWIDSARQKYPVMMNGQPHIISAAAVLAMIEIESKGNPNETYDFSSSRGLSGAMAQDEGDMLEFFSHRQAQGNPIVPSAELIKMRQKKMRWRERIGIYEKAMDDEETSLDYGVRHLQRKITTFNRLNPKNPISPESADDIWRIYWSNNMGGSGATDGITASMVPNIEEDHPLLKHYKKAAEKLRKRGKPTTALAEFKARKRASEFAGKIGKAIARLAALEDKNKALYAAVVGTSQSPRVAARKAPRRGTVASIAASTEQLQRTLSGHPEAIATASQLSAVLPNEPHRAEPENTTRENVEAEDGAKDYVPLFSLEAAKIAPRRVMQLPDGTYTVTFFYRKPAKKPNGKSKNKWRRITFEHLDKLTPQVENFMARYGPKPHPKYPNVRVWEPKGSQRKVERNWIAAGGIIGYQKPIRIAKRKEQTKKMPG